MRVHVLPDFYPAGDEFILTYEVTGRVVPPGGIPPNVGVLTANVETLLNIARGKPVTRKYLTVAGAVARPATLCVPIGVSFAEAIAAAGGPTCERYDVLVGGAMMGRLARDTAGVVTRTTGGLLVLPDDHPLLGRYRRDVRAINRIGRSACDQCVFCTQLCPRYLLGHPIEPHRAMRALGLVHDPAPEVAGTIYCCECNLCSMMACPEDLDPKSVCVQAKATARERGLEWKGATPREPHPLLEARRTPLRRLRSRLGLREFRDEGPLCEETLRPARVTIPLRQNVGAPARPVVKAGEMVEVGQVVGDVDSTELGCPVHASIAGRVTDVRADAVVIERRDG
jgi:Na+-translocating ferredoxin:NAD+ oxidoreductase RnfC subunit